MPLAAVLGVTVSGALIVARQVTAPSQQYPRRLAVGRSRSVEIAATVKGSRPLPKVYTDLTAAAEGPRIWYSMGLEPTIALVRPRRQPLDTLARALGSATSSSVAALIYAITGEFCMHKLDEIILSALAMSSKLASCDFSV